MASESRVCDGCGATFPAFERACGACGLAVVRPPVWRWIAALVVLAVAIAAGSIVAYRMARTGTTGPAEADERVVLDGYLMSLNERGTDISGTVANGGVEAADIWVRVLCYDVSGKVFRDEVIGPFRGIAPGIRRSFRHFIDATPIEKVELEVARARKSDQEAR